MWADWQILCGEIGERRAGSAAEAQAAAFIADRWRAAGLPVVRTESFACTRLDAAEAAVQVRQESGWQDGEAVPLVGAPSTPGKKWVEGPLVWLEMPEMEPCLRPGSLQGCVVGWFGPMPTSVDIHRALLAARPLAIVHVDDRFPVPWIKSDGTYPYWVKRYGLPPTVTVPYQDAWRWRCQGVSRLRVRVAVDLAAARSQNVIGELPGSDPDLPGLLLSCHHDTQCGNPGADDNGSGTIALLALARVLAGRSRRRTIRWASFGTEEQLSVGAAAYVRRHGLGPRETGLVINFDSTASPLGHSLLWLAGAPELGRSAQRSLARRGLHVTVRPDITPFVDCFPFNRAGIPSLWFRRNNFPGGRWQHHSRHDTLDNVSVTQLERLLLAVVPWVERLADLERWPFPTTLSAAQKARARRISRELFGW